MILSAIFLPAFCNELLPATRETRSDVTLVCRSTATTLFPANAFTSTDYAVPEKEFESALISGCREGLA